MSVNKIEPQMAFIFANIGYRRKKERKLQRHLVAFACRIIVIQLYDIHNVAFNHHCAVEAAEDVVFVVDGVEHERERLALVAHKALVVFLCVVGANEPDMRP